MELRTLRVPFALLGLLLVHAASAQTTVYDYTGLLQTYTVPADVTILQLDTWGAGGGEVGGAGAHVQGDLAVTPGQVFALIVGGSGGGAYDNEINVGQTFGGGGGHIGEHDVLAGAGGGMTALELNGVPVVIAAGGGGGTYVTIGAHAWRGGGGGGIDQGGYPSDGPATPGTQTAPGNVGAGMYYGGSPIAGPGAGGGSGLWGGGAGYGSDPSNYADMPGAGGSSLVNNLSNVIAVAGGQGRPGGVLPDGTNDPNYIARVGAGGPAGVGVLGGSGLIVINAIKATDAPPVTPVTPEPGTLGLLFAGVTTGGYLWARQKVRHVRGARG